MTTPTDFAAALKAIEANKKDPRTSAVTDVNGFMPEYKVLDGSSSNEDTYDATKP